MVENGKFGELEVMICDKIWNNGSIERMDLMSNVASCVGENHANFAEFIAGDLINMARSYILNIRVSNNYLHSQFEVEDLENEIAQTTHMLDFFGKIKEVSAIIAAYDEWKDDRLVF